MKKLLILSTLCLALFSCSVQEKPEFLGVYHVKVSEYNAQYIILNAEAHFKNPNSVGGELSTNGLKVFVNDNDIATVTSETFEVPANKEFSIPLTSKIPTDSLLSSKNLSSILGSFLNKNIKVQYKGDIKYKVFGFSRTYNIDKTENIEIKL
ncbi:LEA type 2 family protein [Pseudotamlana carrageenivorans]|uniref:Late embryogenesis abundant protein LEA-2 subgroup domain-containing protein n=1 Tax=Pseudotamlana carrageenivorans TaxID=2069432 RepID=A0A2I7SMU3_9FLAO|nr:LEA type 2 family protein [Tamlana carrageenivorans]AUS07212.1 hypothetical protein C1A40_18025 [Tamlana carrageenivorans]